MRPVAKKTAKSKSAAAGSKRVSFVFADVYKLLLFYIGLAYGENRVYDIIYPAGCALFALACGICFLYTIKERVKSRRTAAGRGMSV